MDLVIGNRPLGEDKDEAVRKQMLHILKENYGIEEEDFLDVYKRQVCDGGGN